MIPTSYSVFRAPADGAPSEAEPASDPGQGYFAADLPLLSHPELLGAIEPWLALDAAASDRQRLAGRLDAWTCLPCGPYLFVARLAATGLPVRRGGWFAHARAWSLADCGADFDPGLYLGLGAAFCDRPPTVGEAPMPPAPTLEPLDPVLKRRDLAVGLLAHLFHAMAAGLPLILAVPLADFAADSGLARVIAFARAALPTRLARRCRIRVFTRHPERFLGAPGAAAGEGGGLQTDLLAIPEDLAVAALTAVSRQAVLLDARGVRQDGPEPSPDLMEYARAALEGAERFPERLGAFAARCDLLWTGGDPLPAPWLTRSAMLTYRLAVALAGTEAQCGSLLAGTLLDLARAEPDLPWSALIRPQDWARFPQDHLIRFLLRTDAGLGEGERRLQEAMALAFQARGASLDEGLAAWWSPSDPAKRRRLLELADLAPPLISAERCADLTRGLALAQLAADGAPLAGVLRAELAQGVLGPRLPELVRLSDRLAHPGLAGLLLDAWQSGALPAPWACDDRGGASDPAAAALLDALMRLAPEPATARLIEQGAWLPWRRHAAGAIDRETLRQLAMTWLLCPALESLRGERARRRPPQWRIGRSRNGAGAVADVSLETWQQVLDDLDPLGIDEVRRLTEPDIRWPWLYPFQDEQMRDLAARCATPEALAGLVESLVRATGEPPETLRALLWGASRWCGELTERAADLPLAAADPGGMAGSADPDARDAGEDASRARPEAPPVRRRPPADPGAGTGARRRVWPWLLTGLLLGLAGGALGALWLLGRSGRDQSEGPGASAALPMPMPIPMPMPAPDARSLPVAPRPESEPIRPPAPVPSAPPAGPAGSAPAPSRPPAAPADPDRPAESAAPPAAASPGHRSGHPAAQSASNTPKRKEPR